MRCLLYVTTEYHTGSQFYWSVYPETILGLLVSKSRDNYTGIQCPENFWSVCGMSVVSLLVSICRDYWKFAHLRFGQYSILLYLITSPPHWSTWWDAPAAHSLVPPSFWQCQHVGSHWDTPGLYLPRGEGQLSLWGGLPGGEYPSEFFANTVHYKYRIILWIIITVAFLFMWCHSMT